MKPKIMVVIGTRPEAIKMAPVLRQLARSQSLDHTLCVTAQHRELLDQVLETFDLTPDIDLNLMQPAQTLDELTSRVVSALTPVFEARQPNVVLVHGDTSTTLATTLAAFYKGVDVGHVEAGLRSHDLGQPYPEEMNRVLTDRLSRYHFAPTPLARRQLLEERIAPDHIVVTGNTVIDALQLALPQARLTPVEGGPDLDGKRMILVTAHRRERFGEGLKAICMAIREIVEAFSDVAVVFPVHLNPNVQQAARAILSEHPRIHLIDPLPYLSFLRLMSEAHLVLTDSGGIQEEAPSLNKPVLVMRDVTERPEGIHAGVLKLVGTARSSIVSETTHLLTNPALYEAMAGGTNPYGDGEAAARIVHYLEKTLSN